MTRPDDTFHVFDTTLRDGAQREGISFSVADKLAVARLLDELGVGFIEGGWPGAMPEGHRVLRPRPHRAGPPARPARRVRRHPQGRGRRRDDPQVRALLDSAAPVVCLVAKSDVRHVAEALRTTLEENLAMVADTVAHLVAHGRRVFVDLEHFFDGYRHDPRLRGGAAAAGVRRRGRASGSCATPTAACSPPASARSWPTSWRAAGCGWASTARTTPAARWPTPSPRSRPAPPTCSAPRTGTASAPATPTCSRWWRTWS